MKRLPLLLPLLIALVVAACAGKPPKAPPAPVKPPAATQAPAVKLKPPLPSYRYTQRSYKDRILNLARHEWEFFGNQRVIYDDQGESIPRVGHWEDDDYRHADRVNMYWRSAHSPGLDGYDCRQPWSAAFISWIMEAAGVSEELFPPAKAHWVYLSHMLNGDSAFVPRTIREYSPVPGDLICATREPVVSPYISSPPPAYILENSKLHCDIVVEKRGQTLSAIGGNVRNSVSRSELTLTPEGRLQPTPTRQWFLVIENRLD